LNNVKQNKCKKGCPERRPPVISVSIVFYVHFILLPAFAHLFPQVIKHEPGDRPQQHGQKHHQTNPDNEVAKAIVLLKKLLSCLMI
jgi:hypothetical protein